MNQETGKKLTGKQKKWLEEYFACGLNATEAARRAGYSSPAERGYENRHHPAIAPLIEERMRKDAMSADEVLFRLKAHAQADISDFEDETGTITRESLKKAKENGFGFLIKEITIERSEYAGKIHEKITLKLHDSQSALVHIGRTHKLFTDKHEHGLDAATRKLLTREDLQELTDEQLAAIATGRTTSGS